MKKIVGVWLIAAAVSIVLAGCSAKDAIVGAEEHNSETMMAMTYRVFTGEKKEVFEVVEGKEAWVQVDILTEDGSLNVAIVNSKNESIYEGTDFTTSSSFSVKAKAGTYTIIVTGKEHEGSYRFKWNIKDTPKDEAVTDVISLEDNKYNVFKGTIGSNNILVALLPNKEQFRVDCSIVGLGDSEDKTIVCTYDLHGNISYDKDGSKLLLSQTEEGNLTGSYLDTAGSKGDVLLTLSHINDMSEYQSRYIIGSDDEVEGFADDIKHMVEADDLESLSTIMSFPLYVTMDNIEHPNNMLVIQNENQLIQLGNQILTATLKNAIASSYTQFMLNNQDGVRLGDESHNIWFTKTADGLLKIMAITDVE